MARLLNPSEAARRLGVSIKALRLYEQHGLIVPDRTAAGWRTYGPDEISRVDEILVMRELGLGLGQIRQVLTGDASDLESTLAAHQTVLEDRLHRLAGAVHRLRRLRADLANGTRPAVAEPASQMRRASPLHVAFDLPWPWDGEPFELHEIRPLNHIVGPLGCGKTRLAQRLAEALPGAVFVGLDRLADGGANALERMSADPRLRSRVDRLLDQLIELGAAASEALLTLLVALEASDPAIMVVDMLEQGLDQSTQRAVIGWLRRRAPDAKPMFFLTRSSAILDLDQVGQHESIIFCPANHSPPSLVTPVAGAPGYEALASCLAAPEVRARTAGVIAWRPEIA